MGCPVSNSAKQQSAAVINLSIDDVFIEGVKSEDEEKYMITKISSFVL